MTTAAPRRQLIAAPSCKAATVSSTAELERAAVPRLRTLSGVLAVFAAILLVIFLLIARGTLESPELRAVLPGVLIGQAIAALAMTAVTLVPSWPARRIAAIGIGFEIAVAASLAIVELYGVSIVTLWIMSFAVVPTTPRRAAVAAFGAAATVPLAYGLAVVFAGHGELTPSEIVRCGGTLAVAVIAVITSRAIYGLQCSVASARRLGAYELVEPLGEGGMGEVWRATHQTLARPAAIKLIRHELVAHLGSAERDVMHRRFRSEVQATAMLTSPHTVAVYDFGETDDGELYYVMELLHGLDVERLVARHGPQPAERVIHLVRQACVSLEEAHRRELVHRDIKPANLQLCAIGNDLDFVKVLDFGLVHGVERGLRLTATGAVSGTPAYLAPEAVSRGRFDARSDIYALGCVAYWLLTGTLVFDAELPGAMMAAHIHDAPEPPSRRTELAIPGELDAIVLACLAKDPGARPQTAGELDALLAAVPTPPWTRLHAEAWWHTHLPDIAARASGGRGARTDRRAAGPVPGHLRQLAGAGAVPR